MEIETVVSLIGSLGFPIVACIACFMTLQKQNEQHREESKAMTEAINELKLAITSLIDKLDK